MILKPVFIIAIVSVFSLFIVFPNVDAAGIDFQYQHKETWKNVGEMTNSGIEITLNYQVVIYSIRQFFNFKW